MVEIGTSGWPWRASGIAIGTALAAEADGAHMVWFTDRPRIGVEDVDWPAVAGPLLPIVPDPGDIADPVVTAAAALLVTRRIGVGILGWSPGGDAARAARTLVTLADLAPGRAVVALAAEPSTLRAVAAAVPPVPLELAVFGESPDTAAELGWGWIAPATGADALAKAAGDAGVTATVGVHLPVAVHADVEVARRAVAAPLLASLAGTAGSGGIVVGDADALGTAIDEYAARGVTRFVLDDVLALGAPEELEAGRTAVRGAIRSARLRHRDGDAR
jgi:hypothetical protein